MKAGRYLEGCVLAVLISACGGGQRGVDAPAGGDGASGGRPATDSEPTEGAEQTGPAERTFRGGRAGDEAPAERTAATRHAGAAERDSSEPPVLADLPTTCTSVDDLCLPPRAFVRRLCRDAFTGAAIRLFEKSSPFSRGYVRSREVKSVNTLGGPTSDASLRFGEEVVILTRTGMAGPGEMQVSGMGGYDVLRWDGTCASLADGELARRPPVPARHAPFAWRYIDTNIQNALLSNSSIEAARRLQKKHCHGVSLGRLSPACVKAEDELQGSIVAAVRTGMKLPLPERMP
jgi:hypothetical protein